MGNVKVKGRKIRVSNNEKEIDKEVIEEDKLDREIETEDNMSFALMIFILAMCFIVGTVVGYLLYRLAINNSNALYIYDLFKLKM